MKKDKNVITGTYIGIICYIIGIIASIMLIVSNYFEHESMALGIILLCICIANLSTNLKNIKDNQ